MPRREGEPLNQSSVHQGLGLLDAEDLSADVMVAEEEPTAPPEASAPGPTFPALLQGLEPLPEVEVRRDTIPVFKTAIVVYLGNQTNRSVSLPGKIMLASEEQLDGPPVELREAISEGTEVYDFSTRDILGRVIYQRLAPASMRPYGCERKPWVKCEHARHLLWFMQALGPDGRPEFKPFFRGDEQAAFLDWARRQTRAEKRQTELINQVMKNV